MQSPVWMDSSTTKQCHDFEQAVGGPKVKHNQNILLNWSLW